MRKLLNVFSVNAAVLLAVMLFAMTPAQAQFTIEIGISRDKAVKRMTDLGYSQISILKKGFKTIRAEACQNGIRYEVRVADGYQVSNVRQTGVCRRTVSSDALERNLTQSGFTRIVIERQNGNYIALACRNSNRLRITFSDQGEVLQRRKIGRCEDIFQPNDVRKVLQEAGYNRINFIDRQLPWYRAEACRDEQRVELLLTRYGEVRRELAIGRCAPELRPNRIASFLEELGYDRIEVIDNRLPNYKVGACLKSDRFRLELDRYGQITSRSVTGKCPNLLNEEEITELLENEGFTRVEVERTNRGDYQISACLEGFLKYATLSRTGELLQERDGPRCESRSASDMYRRLEQRGFNDLQLFAEGCRRGKKIRIYFNALGDRARREVIGNC